MMAPAAFALVLFGYFRYQQRFSLGSKRPTARSIACAPGAYEIRAASETWVSVARLSDGYGVPMTNWATLKPAEQRRLLEEQMRTWRALDKLTAQQTAEAIARSRELLRVKVYWSPKLNKDC
ncbi:hypothetical protein [Methylobacterium sp. C1]|jgi:hypothetical protein|uniref:hypothetical protein n=1 Tax=unclassified Methylobacterium TaxID=2615210 RepID=UPI00133119DD|nr:hypothetical protein [Methylobacterium sp. C1]